jgi:hypothetical protein
MTNTKLPKPPLPSGQSNPSLNELVAIKSDPNDIGFDESMTGYGSSGWQAVTCRRAKDSLDSIGYECILIREKP